MKNNFIRIQPIAADFQITVASGMVWYGMVWYGIGLVEFNVPLDTASIGHFGDGGPEQ